jgi:hypothetical protein
MMAGMTGMSLMTNSIEHEKESKTSVADHVADTHRHKPVVGQVVTGDIVGGEVTEHDAGSGDDNKA